MLARGHQGSASETRETLRRCHDSPKKSPDHPSSSEYRTTLGVELISSRQSLHSHRDVNTRRQTGKYPPFRPHWDRTVTVNPIWWISPGKPLTTDCAVRGVQSDKTSTHEHSRDERSDHDGSDCLLSRQAIGKERGTGAVCTDTGSGHEPINLYFSTPTGMVEDGARRRTRSCKFACRAEWGSSLSVSGGQVSVRPRAGQLLRSGADGRTPVGPPVIDVLPVRINRTLHPQFRLFP